MIPPDLDLAERQAAAQPRDYPQDMWNPACDWQVCNNCLRVFMGKPSRHECRCCTGEPDGR